MEKVKMTPTLAKALAARVVDRVNDARKIENDITEEAVLKSKEFKRMMAIRDEKAKLDNEYLAMEKVIKALHPTVSCISQGRYGEKLGKWFVTFNNPWVNSEVIKNQILLNGTFTTDSVDNIIEGVVTEHLKR